VKYSVGIVNHIDINLGDYTKVGGDKVANSVGDVV